MKWKSAILTLLLLSAPRSPVEAAPAYSLEGLLKRAEIVYVGRVSEQSLERVINFSTLSAMIYGHPLPLRDLVNFLDGTKSLSK
jgi:hypothetical protein